MPFLLEWLACALLYIVIPNCAVRWRDAMLGATVASVSIEMLKIGFVIYIGSLSSYQIVYGAIATIPIFLLWMYVSWMAVLLGAVVAANLPTWKVDERFHHLSSGGVRLGFSLSLIAALDRGQRRGETYSTADLAAELGVPTSVLDAHLKVLARAGFTAPTQGGALGAGVEPRDRDIARSLSGAGPAARRDVAGPAERAVAEAGRAGDGAYHPGRGGGDARDARLAARRHARPGGTAPAMGITDAAGATGCRARPLGVVRPGRARQERGRAAGGHWIRRDAAEIIDEIADDEPFAPFARWFELAMKSEPLAETMMLATATRDGVPSVRAVLLKGADANGFVFYTNLESRKAEELRANPRAALCFHWKSLGRQIRIEGDGRAGRRRGGRRLFRDAGARQPDRRLGVGAVAAARKPCRARSALRRVPGQIRRAGARTAAGQLGGLSRAAGTVRVLAGTAVPAA